MAGNNSTNHHYVPSPQRKIRCNVSLFCLLTFTGYIYCQSNKCQRLWRSNSIKLILFVFVFVRLSIWLCVHKSFCLSLGLLFVHPSIQTWCVVNSSFYSMELSKMIVRNPNTQLRYLPHLFSLTNSRTFQRKIRRIMKKNSSAHIKHYQNQVRLLQLKIIFSETHDFSSLRI